MRSVVALIAILGLSTSALAQDPGEAAALAAGLPTAIEGGPGNVIWDEGVDGDLDVRTAPTTVMLASPSDSIIGNVGGAQPEFEDCSNFDVPAGNSVSVITLTDYVPDGGNVTSGFNLYTGVTADPAAFGDIVSIAVGAANIGDDLLNTNGPLLAGNYTMCMLEGTPNQGYVLTIGSDIVAAGPPQVIPTLGTWGLIAMIMLLAMVATAAMRRRQQI